MNKEAGMTMVELLITVTVMGIIIAFLGTAVYQILNISGYGNEQLEKLHDLQNAGAWFQMDTQGALSATGGSQLTLTLSDNSTVVYSLTGTDLRRITGGPTITLARNVDSASFNIQDRLATMSLSCVPSWRDNASENGTYIAYLRPAEVVSE